MIKDVTNKHIPAHAPKTSCLARIVYVSAYMWPAKCVLSKLFLFCSRSGSVHNHQDVSLGDRRLCVCFGTDLLHQVPSLQEVVVFGLDSHLWLVVLQSPFTFKGLLPVSCRLGDASIRFDWSGVQTRSC